MKKTRSLVTALVCGLAAALGGTEVRAGWNPLSWFPSNRVDTLMVAGNYLKPRLLAELAQQRNGQPILLISPTRDGGEELYFLPAEKAAWQEAAKNFVAYVEYVKPKQVIFIGDSDYMPSEYIEQLRNRLPVVVIAGDDWNKNAETLANTMKLKGLPERFAYLSAVAEPQAEAPATETLTPEPAVPAAIPAATVPAEPSAPSQPAAPAAPLEKKVTVTPGTAK